jgi:hypothetical protein
VAEPQSLTVCRTYASFVLIADEGLVQVERRSDEERRQAASVAFAVGGVLGPALAAVLARVGMPGGPTRLYLRGHDLPAFPAITDVTTCWAADAPADLVARPDWPRVEGYRPVTFYPRGQLADVALSMWHGITLRLKREAAPVVSLPIAPWDHARARLHLERAGYPLVAAEP